MSAEHVEALLEHQSGVIARHQVLAPGGHTGDLERRLRRREWVRLLPGVFLDHTGEPTWLQRAWAGVLACWPAALSHESALRAANGPGWRGYADDLPIQLAVDRQRHVKAPPGYVLRRTTVADRVQWNLSPPRVRFDAAVIDVASTLDGEMSVIETLADACRARRTTPERLLAEARARPRLSGRQFIEGVLEDVAAGVCSVLEHGYLTRVERPHGLPIARRQAPGTATLGGVLRDVDYQGLGLIVELDGRLFHSSARQRDRDLDRDLDATVDGLRSVRLGWGQVYDRPCLTARRVGRILQQKGWSGRIVRCGPGCPA